MESIQRLQALSTAKTLDPDPVDLVEQARRGAPGAAEALWRGRSGAMIRVAIALGVRPEEAEDVVQETLLHAFSRLHKYDSGRAPFSVWLHRILVSRCSNSRRAARRFTAALTRLTKNPWSDPTPGPAEALVSREAHMALEALVRDLPPRRRAVWALTQIAEISALEVARILGMKEVTVRSHLRHAAESMRRALEVSR
ncbi:MAG: sigma-70 family RNA polymerase sigma factor [Acidobacteria bacterium]|nr:sigma-70 family RNA polymerase sigma factor [Acidobacteriota bacterium]